MEQMMERVNISKGPTNQAFCAELRCDMAAPLGREYPFTGKN
jgi:hypothetical protein